MVRVPAERMGKKSEKLNPPILGKIVEKRIFLIRGQRVMLSSDLAELYQVQAKALLQAVKRNLDRFPEDFMFQLNGAESAGLSRSQFVTLKRGQNLKYAPYAFTEQGVAMLSSVLRSRVAVQVNIEIMRAFVRFRELASTNAQVLRKVDDLEKRVSRHDGQFRQVFQAIRELVQPISPAKRPIGIKRETQDHKL
jgi:hypothetical protein